MHISIQIYLDLDLPFRRRGIGDIARWTNLYLHLHLISYCSPANIVLFCCFFGEGGLYLLVGSVSSVVRFCVEDMEGKGKGMDLGLDWRGWIWDWMGFGGEWENEEREYERKGYLLLDLDGVGLELDWDGLDWMGMV